MSLARGVTPRVAGGSWSQSRFSGATRLYVRVHAPKNLSRQSGERKPAALLSREPFCSSRSILHLLGSNGEYRDPVIGVGDRMPQPQ